MNDTTLEKDTGPNVVISGATGFIGDHLVRHLTKNGYRVFALVESGDVGAEKLSEIKGCSVVETNLLKGKFLIDAIPDEPEAFLHFAWAGVSPETRESIEIQRINIDLTINAVQIAYTVKAKEFIFHGSTFEYSYSGEIINRHTSPSPHNAYGATKLSAKYYSEILCRKLKIPYIYTVISGIYSEDRLDNNVITYTIRKLLKGERPLLTKLEQKWDYVHIDDVTNAIQMIIEKGKDKGFYVIGHGDNWPLANYVYKIRDVIDPSLPLGVGEIPYSDGMIPMSCVDLNEIREDIGFEPRISFEEGITEVINRIKEEMGKSQLGGVLHSL